MRDAFGGVFMIRLMLVFIFLYVIFTALALNYAKAFRIKNSIIDLIEQTEIKDLNEFSEGNAEKVKKLNKLLAKANYVKECKRGNIRGLKHVCHVRDGRSIECAEVKISHDSTSKHVRHEFYIMSIKVAKV